MEKIIVLGIGNLLMMDDGIGIYLVDELSKLNPHSRIEYIAGESDIDYCIEQIERATFIIILDAVSSGKNPGERSLYPLTHLYDNQTLDISPHNLHLFQVLHQRTDQTKGFLIGIEPSEIRFQIGLSNPIKQIWDEVITDVGRIIQQLIAYKNISY